MIQIENLSFSYPSSALPALKGLSLKVPQGSLFGLLGPNGSGKTTLISLLSGVLPLPAGARVSVAQPRASCSLVPQEYAFYPTLKISENLRFFAGVQGIAGAERGRRVSEALALAGLEGAAELRAERASGGMKRRLNIAIGMLNRPKLLFLDEPTVGIDPQSRAFILKAVRAINKKGCTVIYTSHYMEEVSALCDRIAVIDQGALLAEGSLRQLLKPGRRGKPKDLEELFMRLTKRELRD